jgi:hypothetical protein
LRVSTRHTRQTPSICAEFAHANSEQQQAASISHQICRNPLPGNRGTIFSPQWVIIRYLSNLTVGEDISTWYFIFLKVQQFKAF